MTYFGRPMKWEAFFKIWLFCFEYDTHFQRQLLVNRPKNGEKEKKTVQLQSLLLLRLIVSLGFFGQIFSWVLWHYSYTFTAVILWRTKINENNSDATEFLSFLFVRKFPFFSRYINIRASITQCGCERRYACVIQMRSTEKGVGVAPFQHFVSFVCFRFSVPLFAF